MNYVNGFVNGLLFGAGVITASWAMKLLFHIGLCG